MPKVRILRIKTEAPPKINLRKTGFDRVEKVLYAEAGIAAEAEATPALRREDRKGSLPGTQA